MAWSRKALNLISALHSTSGLGVRPAWYSRRNSAKTRSLYSEAKFTCSISMPTTSATAAASTKSTLDEQYSLSSSSSQFFMKMPTTSWPCCLRRWAVTAESTPPDRPTTTRCLVMVAIIPAPFKGCAPRALQPCASRNNGPLAPRKRPHALRPDRSEAVHGHRPGRQSLACQPGAAPDALGRQPASAQPGAGPGLPAVHARAQGHAADRGRPRHALVLAREQRSEEHTSELQSPDHLV